MARLSAPAVCAAARAALLLALIAAAAADDRWIQGRATK